MHKCQIDHCFLLARPSVRPPTPASILKHTSVLCLVRYNPFWLDKPPHAFLIIRALVPELVLDRFHCA
ncbi:hypothetical protein K443DRAFT_641926 [Laccaria amethystina LaAM-08-1]|uniref:Uncharacterized protein n=1 Tax=Laccaria amethystina LaAM-08-1 TaxID=1095629 RepID=A0A0C9XUM7_9AGAR|nr:hypothetical protein K443DRAFT_641926 [Laccaria amethystina LaAM-08-1]